MILHFMASRTTRYTVMGAICAATHNTLMILGGWAGLSYVPMSLLSFLVVTPLGYSLHARFTFGASFSMYDFCRFSGGVAAGFPLYFVVMAFLCSGIRLNIVLASPMTTIVLYVWNYASARWAMRGRLDVRSKRATFVLNGLVSRRPGDYEN